MTVRRTLLTAGLLDALPTPMGRIFARLPAAMDPEFLQAFVEVLEALVFTELAVGFARVRSRGIGLGDHRDLVSRLDRAALGSVVELLSKLPVGLCGWEFGARHARFMDVVRLRDEDDRRRKEPTLAEALGALVRARNEIAHPSRGWKPTDADRRVLHAALRELTVVSSTFDGTLVWVSLEQVRNQAEGLRARGRLFHGLPKPFHDGELFPVPAGSREGELVLVDEGGKVLRLDPFVVLDPPDGFAVLASTKHYWNPASGTTREGAADAFSLLNLDSVATGAPASGRLEFPIDRARADALSERAAREFVVDDRMVLEPQLALRILESDAGEGLPEWLEPDDFEVLRLLVGSELTEPIVGHRLKLLARGTAGRPGFRIESEWCTERGRVVRPQPMRRGVLLDHDGREYRLSSAQYSVLEVLDDAPSDLGHDRGVDLAFTARVLAAVREGEGVELDAFLQRNEARAIDAVRPRLHPVEGGYQVRVSAPGVDDAALDEHLYSLPESRWGSTPISTRVGDRRVRSVLMPRAVKGLQRAKELGVLDARGVSLALSRPEDVFGADFDLSELSERVVGLGPMVRRVPAVVRELQELEWWKWTGGVATEDVAGEVDDATLSLADEHVRSALRDSIAWADENGATFVPHPSEEGAQLELTPALRERLSLAERRARGEPLPTEYASPAGSQPVLLVKENLESVEFDRARSVDELTRRLRLGAPPGLATGFQLFPYQQEGFEWLASRYDETASDHGGGGVLLGDDMGLGKTLQVLSFLSWLRAHRRGAGPHLVVAPVGLLTNWMRESRRFFGTTLDAVLEARGAVFADRDSAVDRLEAAHLVLTSYEVLRRGELTFARVPWDVVVLDEAQKAKNPGTQIARVVRTLSARFRLAMTGTPVENSLTELWTLFDWAVPGLLGSLRSFGETFVKPLARREVEPESLSDMIQRSIGPVFARRLKSEVLAGLPELTMHRHETPLSAEQEAAYDARMRLSGSGDALGKLQSLFSIVAHPRLAASDTTLPSVKELTFPKIAEFLQVLDDVHAAGEKAVIFANRVRVQDWLSQCVAQRYGVPAPVINGQVNESRQRMAIIDEFSGRLGFAALVLAPKAAGVGLNITAANHVLHYTREWNPALENQANDRCFRLGQKRPVHVHTFVATSHRGTTVDEVLDELLTRKRELMRQFVVPMGGFEVTSDDMLAKVA